MSDFGLVTESMRALREGTTGASPAAAGTRARVLARVEGGRRRRRRALFAVMPLAAALFVSSAWAAVSGRLPARLEEIGASLLPSSFFGERHRPTAPVPAPYRIAPAPVVAARAPAPEPALVAGGAEGISVAPAPTPARTSQEQSSHAHVAAHATPAVPKATATVPQTSPSSSVFAREEALYDTAHRAHFVAREPASALRAWDAYLAEYPEGAYALEAKYNRAITLVRLGRRDEARSALAPFARGAYGGYRRVEAQRLLDVLELRP